MVAQTATSLPVGLVMKGRIERLHYKIVHGDKFDYEHAPPLVHESDDFALSVSNLEAVFELKHDYFDEEAAREAVRPFIAAWELDAGLTDSPCVFHLAFERVTREASPTGADTVYLCANDAAALTTRGTAHVSKGAYPRPPVALEVTPEVDLMYTRYTLYLEGRDTLPATAYFCHTALTHKWGDEGEAARELAISRKVLKCLGRLSSYKGGAYARKADAASTPLSSEESQWIEAALKAIIRRSAERAALPRGNLKQITQSDLPELSPRS